MADFTFIASNSPPFDGLTLEDSPLGGTETAVIRLCEALAKRGHRVKVWTKHDSPRSSIVKFESLNNFNEDFQTDVLVAVREWLGALIRAKTKRRFFWTGDAYDQNATFGIGDRRVSNILSGLICVSAWHATTLSSHSGFPIEKTYVIRNGVYLPYFASKDIKKKRKSLIYSSTPYRGLEIAVKLFRKIKEMHPEAEFNIYSGYDVYGDAQGQDRVSFEKFSQNIKKEEGINLKGNVLQSELAKQFLESSILFYPNTFAETSCITALEAQAAGCVVLSSNLGALPETVGDCGVLINGNPNSVEYQEAFIAAADKLLSNDKYWNELSEKSVKKIQKEYSWDTIAQQFEQLTVAKS